MKKTLSFLLLLAGAVVRSDAQGCSSCGAIGAGGLQGSDVGPSLNVSMGAAQYGQSAGALTFNSGITNATLLTPIALQYDSPTRTDVQVLTTNILTTNLIAALETDAVLVTNYIYLTNSTSAGSTQVVAGDGSGGNPVSANALNVSLSSPQGVALDGAGNFYIADAANAVVWKVNLIGEITAVAGNGSSGYSGDGAAATSEELNYPTGVALDSAGNLYIADAGNDIIRKVAASSGIITTVAGTPQNGGYYGDGAAATSAQLNYPTSVAVDHAGNLYIADSYNDIIRKVAASSGNITTVAGTPQSGGYTGDGAAATSEELNYPTSVAVDSAGNLYIADSDNEIIRKVTVSSGIITTVAGVPQAGGYTGDGAAATSEDLNSPTSVTVDAAGNLYIADNGNQLVRKVNASGVISTVTRILYSSSSTSVAVDGAGNVYLANAAENIVSKINPNGLAATVAGNGSGSYPEYGRTGGYSGNGGIAATASLNGPTSVALDGAGNVYIADYGNNVIRKVASGGITTVAGTGFSGYSGNGGPASVAQLNGPTAVAIDSAGNLYIADYGNNVIRKVSAAGTITTLAGSGTRGYSGDGGAATSAKLNGPMGLSLDGSGNLYIADYGNNVIRKVSTAGTITTVAGNGSSGYSGDGGAATSAKLNGPVSVALDHAGNLYIADSGNLVVRKVAGGTITTVAGNGSPGDAGDGGPAISASLSAPTGVTVDGSGNLYIGCSVALNNYSVVREVSSGGIISTVDSQAPGGFCGVTVDTADDLFVAENGYNVVFELVGAQGITNITPTTVYNFQDVVITNYTALVTTNAVIRQVLAPQALADIPMPPTTNGYVINFYYPANIVGNNPDGTYQLSGTPFITWLITNSSPSSAFQMQISEFGLNPNYGLIKQWTNNYSTTTGSWSMTTLGGIQETMQTTNLNATTFEVIDTVQSIGGTVVQQVVNTYQIFNWSESVNVALVTNTVGIGAAAKITSYTYWDPATFDAGSLTLKSIVTHPDGSWEYYSSYDNLGRALTVYSSFGDAAVGDTVNGRETDYTYDPGAAGVSGTGDDGTLNIYTPRLVVQKIQGNIVSQSYYVCPTPGTNYQVQCTKPNPAGGWSDPGNLITTNLYYTSGPNQFELMAVQRPDGTLTTYNYITNTTYRTNITVTGQADPTDSHVVDGVSNVLVLNIAGYKVTAASYDVLSGLTLANDTYANFDSYGRPQQVTHLDGTTEYMQYACCGLENTVDRDGVNTVYLYDLDRRQYGNQKYFSAVGNPVTYQKTLDAAGQVVQLSRIGTDSSTIIQGQLAYDTAGRLVMETNALGGVTMHVETITGTGGLIRTTTNPDGGTRVEAYYLDGSIKSVTGTAIHGKAYGYGASVDVNLNYCSYMVVTNLDNNGNLTTEWLQAFTDMAGRITEVLYSDGNYSQSFYNAQGQLVKQIDPDGVITLYKYNAKGDLAYTTADLNQNSVIDFGGMDRVTQGTNDVIMDHGTIVRRARNFVWTQNGINISNLTSMAENSADGLQSWQIQFADANTAITNRTQTSYANPSRTVKSTAPDGSYVVNSYSYGRLVSSSRYDSTGAQIGGSSYAYDSHNRQYQLTDARDGTITSGYNNADQVISVTTPLPGGGQSAETTTTLYDTMLRPYNVTQPDGTTATSVYLLTGELGLQFGSRTYPVSYSYDYAGRMKTMTNWSSFSITSPAGSRVTTWNYDGQRGWLTNKAYADGKGPAYTYTPAGRLLTRAWVRGVTTTYSYDNAGGLKTVSYSDTTPGVTYTYDRLGRQGTVAWNGITDTMSYNLAGELLGEAYSGGFLSGLAVTNRYDTDQRRTNVAFLNASSILASTGYAYDFASRLSTVADTNGDTANYSYLANSPLVSQIVFKQNGATRMTTTKAYDDLNRLTQISSAPGAANVLPLTFNYNYNLANQRTRDTLADGSYWVYGYDSLGQVTNGCKYFASGTPVPGQQFDYTFDTIGNRTQTMAGGDTNGANLRVANYSANSLNQITSRDVPAFVDIMGASILTNAVTVNGQAAYRNQEYYRQQLAANNSASALWTNITVSDGQTMAGNIYLPQEPEHFSYDPDGNLTNDGRWAYTWDAENRLIGMTTNTTAGPPYQLTFAYDAKGRRIQKTVATNGISTTIRFLYDGWNLVAVLNPQSSLLQSFMWGSDLSVSLQGAGGVGGLLEVTYYGATTTNCFPAYDGNGNVSAIINSVNGSISANYEYGPFGEVIRQTGPMAKTNPVRFSTKYQDDESDLIYSDYRYYKASTGTWLSRDPFLSDDGLALNRDSVTLNQVIRTAVIGDANLYGFCRNDSVDNTDPLGLLTFTSGCKTVRYTETPVKFDLDTYIAGAKIEIANRTTVQTCPRCCKDGSAGALISASNDYRVTGEVKATVFTFGVVKVSPYGGVTGGGSIMSRTDTCTGKTHVGGCYFYTFRFGVEGCAGIPGGGEFCLRGEGNYTSRTCPADTSLSTECLFGRVMVRVKILWRTYDYVAYQIQSCSNGPITE